MLRWHEGVFVIAGMALSLLLIAIHNAWDTVVYVVVDRHGVQAPPVDNG